MTDKEDEIKKLIKRSPDWSGTIANSFYPCGII